MKSNRPAVSRLESGRGAFVLHGQRQPSSGGRRSLATSKIGRYFCARSSRQRCARTPATSGDSRRPVPLKAEWLTRDNGRNFRLGFGGVRAYPEWIDRRRGTPMERGVSNRLSV